MEELELDPRPFPFSAATVNSYVVPFFSSHNVHDVPLENVVHVAVAGWDETTNRVMA
jgi:hypothetical protein